MAAPPIGPQYLYAASPTYTRAYLLAAVRAGLIALVLLAVLLIFVLL